MGVVVRRYIDFLILLIPTPVYLFFFAVYSIPTFCSFLKTFFVLVSTGFEVSLVSADHLSVLTGPLRVSNSTPHSRQVDFNSTFPWVGPSNQTYLFRVILTLCKELQSFYIIYIYIY